MNSAKTPVWLYVARGVSVSAALAALVAFVVLEHRRLNPIVEPGIPAVAIDEPAAGLPLEIPAVDREDSTDETEAGGRIGARVDVTLDSFQIQVPRVDAALERMPLPDLASTIPVLELPPMPADDDELLVYTSSSEVYMLSSKSMVPVPEPKKRRQPAKKP